MKALGAVALLVATLVVAAGPCWAGPCAPSPCAMPDCAQSGSRWQTASACCCATSGIPAEAPATTSADRTSPKGPSAAMHHAGADALRPAAVVDAPHRADTRICAPPLFLLNTSLLI